MIKIDYLPAEPFQNTLSFRMHDLDPINFSKSTGSIPELAQVS